MLNTKRILTSLFSLTLLFGSAAFAKTVDINTASAAEIAESLTGIGPKAAKAIIDHRKANGPFKSLEDLTAVKGIGKATVTKNKADIKFGKKAASNLKKLTKKEPTKTKKSTTVASTGAININTASAKEIAANLNGIGPKAAAAIVAHRKANGDFTKVEDLTQVKGIGPAALKKNAGKIEVSSASKQATKVSKVKKKASKKDSGLADDLFSTDNSDLININTASAAEMAKGMQGIGAASAKNIVAFRDANGPFQSINELANVKGIGAATIKKNADLITVAAPAKVAKKSSSKSKSKAKVKLSTPITINKASLEELEAQAFIGPVKAERIVEYREQNGKITSLEELKSIKGIGEKTIEKNQQWIKF